MSDFLAMGGYAVFVWSAYGAGFGAAAGLLVYVLAERRAARARLAREEAGHDA